MAESERILRNEDKFQELVDLYSSKRLHKKGALLSMYRPISPPSYETLPIIASFPGFPCSAIFEQNGII